MTKYNNLLLIIILLIIFIHLVKANNNPKCKNGGILDENNRCQCIKGFMSGDCMQKTCENSGVLTRNVTCLCEPQWKGSHCLQCRDDKSCVHGGRVTNETYCDKSLVTHNEKYFSCDIKNEEISQFFGNVMNLQCSRNNKTNNPIVGDPLNNIFTCNIQIWADNSEYHPIGKYVEIFYCTLSHCKIVVENTGQGHSMLNYNCNNTLCECVGPEDKCNPQVKNIIKSMQGSASVSCVDQTGHCKMKQSMFPWDIPVECRGSECVNKLYDGHSNQNKTNLIHPLGNPLLVNIWFLLLLLFFIISTPIICGCTCYHIRKSKIEYNHNKKIISEHYDNDDVNICNETLRVEHLYYKIKPFGSCFKESETILKDINLKLKSGTMTVVMGKSGSGKTSLLDILAQRNKSGYFYGSIKLNGKQLTSKFNRICGYVPSSDVFVPEMTVREILEFTINLKLPEIINKKEKNEILNEVITNLELEQIMNKKIGGKNQRGLSDGEKRKVSIAKELITKPNILILDEPTKGLDADSEYKIIQCLHSLSKIGYCVIFSMHRDSPDVYQDFLSRIVLMSNGQIVYDGHKDNIIATFSDKNNVPRLKSQLPTHFSIKTIAKYEKENKDISKFIVKKQKDTFLGKKSVEMKTIDRNLDDRIEEVSDDDNILSDDDSEMKSLFDNSNTVPAPYKIVTLHYATSFVYQIFCLIKRNLKLSWRKSGFITIHVVSSIFIAIILGILYKDLKYDLEGCTNRISAIYFICLLISLASTTSIEVFFGDRELYKRETSRNYYSPEAYYISKILFDLIPLRIIPTFIIGFICYFLMGLKFGLYHFITFMVVLSLFSCISSLLCVAISSLTQNVGSGSIIAIVFILSNSLFGGIFLSNYTLPTWLQWLPYLSYWHYTIEALLINELHKTDVIVNPKSMPHLRIPGKGDFFLDQFGMITSHFYLDISALIFIVVVFFILAWLLLKFCVKDKA